MGEIRCRREQIPQTIVLARRQGPGSRRKRPGMRLNGDLGSPGGSGGPRGIADDRHDEVAGNECVGKHLTVQKLSVTGCGHETQWAPQQRSEPETPRERHEWCCE